MHATDEERCLSREVINDFSKSIPSANHQQSDSSDHYSIIQKCHIHKCTGLPPFLAKTIRSIIPACRRI